MINEILQDNSSLQEEETIPTPIVQTVERVVTPIQPPIQTDVSNRQNLPGGLTASRSPANPVFATVKASAVTLAFGYPLAYVRALMQVRSRKSRLFFQMNRT